MVDLRQRIDAAGHLLAFLGGLLADPTLVEMEAKHRAIERRLGYLGREVVMALVGGTGSGKSSLLNALAGEAVAPTGVIRPTTDEPLAWIPNHPDPGLSRLLGDLGIVDRVGHDDLPWLAIIDMPDIDSVEFGHRRVVEQLLPRVDVVVWVADPEKYSDRVLHEDFIVPLAPYRDQFVFVLNQIDRVPVADRPEIVAHFSRRLARSGMDATVFPVAAAPPDERPMGLEGLVEELAARFREKDIVRRKLGVDLDLLLDEIRTRLGDRMPVVPAWDRVEPGLVRQATRLLAPPALDVTFAVAGRMTASRHGSGPIGRVVALLRRGGRALGVGQATTRLDEITTRWRERQGRLALEGSVTSTFMDAAQEVGPVLGAPLRVAAASAHHDLDAALDTARRDVAPHLLVPARPWWKALAVAAWIAALAVVAAVAWGWSDPGAVWPAEGFDPVVLGGLGVALGLIVRWTTAAVGTRAGRGAGGAYRQALTDAIATNLRRRLGEGYDEHTERAREAWRIVEGLGTAPGVSPSPQEPI